MTGRMYGCDDVTSGLTNKGFCGRMYGSDGVASGLSNKGFCDREDV